MAISDIVKASLEHIQYIAKTETVFGDPVAVGGVTLIPVSKVSIGFAAGGAGKDDKNTSGAGTGGGVNVTPVAVISISAEGDVQIHSLESGEVDFYSLLSMAPDAVRKVAKFFKRKGKGGKDVDGGDDDDDGGYDDGGDDENGC
jgi:uncharacterized spore protein YtfJ